MLFEERDHLARDVALVEAVASGGDARAAPLLAALRSASTIERQRVRARSGNWMVSPALYAAPSGLSHVRLLSGQDSMNLRLPSIARAVLGRSGNPRSAYSIARIDTCSKRHRPPALEHGERRVQRARNDRGIEADRRSGSCRGSCTSRSSPLSAPSLVRRSR